MCLWLCFLLGVDELHSSTKQLEKGWGSRAVRDFYSRAVRLLNALAYTEESQGEMEGAATKWGRHSLSILEILGLRNRGVTCLKKAEAPGDKGCCGLGVTTYYSQGILGQQCKPFSTEPRPPGPHW